LYNGVDADAFKSAEFVTANLQPGTATAQAWQFLGAAIDTYCPEQTPVHLTFPSGQHGPHLCPPAAVHALYCHWM
jgi:hypothetical protein